jgi:hypothetical protein
MPVKYTDEVFAQKFWERVDKISDPSGCWLWTGYIDSNGYGMAKLKRKSIRTHVLSYNLTGHTIIDGLQLAHSNNCLGKRNCCNPEHLTPKTPSENNLDKHRDGTMTYAKLIPSQVIEIRRRIAAGEKQKDLAQEFGVGRTAITAINSRKTWYHI